jgi:XTP/dITP diphosphohydrolase
MDDLRAQCPWDKKQTMETLRTLTIEETYELADAIIDDDMEEVKKSWEIYFFTSLSILKLVMKKGYSISAKSQRPISDKLVDRHPHIYGDVTVTDEAEVKRNWEKLKLKEGKKSVLEGVPRSLPALVKAQRIQEKAAGIGFDWEQPEQVFDKVREELQEFSEEVTTAG